jgi:ABC-type polysaccharide transport system permease subunit
MLELRFLIVLSPAVKTGFLLPVLARCHLEKVLASLSSIPFLLSWLVEVIIIQDTVGMFSRW